MTIRPFSVPDRTAFAGTGSAASTVNARRTARAERFERCENSRVPLMRFLFGLAGRAATGTEGRLSPLRLPSATTPLGVRAICRPAFYATCFGNLLCQAAHITQCPRMDKEGSLWPQHVRANDSVA